MKKFIAILMCIASIFTLIGCGTEKKPNDSNSGKPAHIVFAYMTSNNIPEAKELERIQTLINEYTIDKINTEVELKLFANSEYSTQVNLMLAGEQQVDIYRAMNGFPQQEYIKNGSALDITEYLDTYLKDAKEAMYDRLIMTTTVNGKVYGLNTIGSNYVPTGFCYRKDITDELGIDMTKVKSVFDLTEVFKKVHAAYPNMILNDPNRMNNVFSAYLQSTEHMDALGNDAANPFSGVVFGEKPTVVNAFESDEFKKVVKLLESWYQSGYFSKDAATSTATTAELASSGNLFSMFAGLGNPKIAANFSVNYGYTYESIKVSDSYMQSYNYDAWLINSATKEPEAAAKFLNLTFTDPYIHNLLSYGEKGVDYVLNNEGFVVAPEGYKSISDVPYTNNINYYMWGSKWLAYRTVGGLNEEEFQKNKAENYAATASYFYGFVFDFSDVEAEYMAVSNIWNEYKKGFWTGSLNVDQELKKMNERMYTAGLQKILDSKQRQLNDWMKSNGIK